MFAQEHNMDTIQPKNNNAFFIELLGATGYFSINYDRKIQVLNQLYIKPGIGVGYFIETENTPNILSYALRLDVQYGDRKINPIVGYAFSHNFDLEDNTKKYLVNNLTLGLNIKVLKRLEIQPKYYLMFFNETDYNAIYSMHWSGIQFRFNF